MKKNKKLLILLTFLLIIIIITVIAYLVLGYDDSKNLKRIKLNFEKSSTKISEFSNDEVVVLGWIQVQGTNINLPVVHASALYEENIDFDYAWRSPSYIDGDNREVILGHNILNVSNQPIYNQNNLRKFEALMNFTYSTFAYENQYIQYSKNNQDDLYIIYAVGFYDYYFDDESGINDKDELDEYIKTAKENSIYDYDVDVDNNDELISIRTCTRYFGRSEKQQFIIEARKVRDEEEIVKYKVSKNYNYDKLNINDLKID